MNARIPPRRDPGRVSVLFVCLGNICRSPTAEGVFRKLVRDAGLDERVRIDSAGTGAWHAGEPPDPRAIRAAARRGIDLRTLVARQVQPADVVGPHAFDIVLAMDRKNLRDLEAMRAQGPHGADVRLFLRDFAPHAGVDEVPDPYFAGADETEGFDRVLDLIEQGSAGLLDFVRRRIPASA